MSHHRLSAIGAGSERDLAQAMPSSVWNCTFILAGCEYVSQDVFIGAHSAGKMLRDIPSVLMLREAEGQTGVTGLSLDESELLSPAVLF